MKLGAEDNCNGIGTLGYSLGRMPIACEFFLFSFSLSLLSSLSPSHEQFLFGCIGEKKILEIRTK